jgi:DNA-directed RNA polymerase specialized sigma subunit
LLIEYIDQQLEYERKALKALDLCLAIEAEIDEACVGNYANALKYRYIEELSIRQIGERMNYSKSQVWRLLDEAIARYAEKTGQMGQNGTLDL